MTQNGNTEMLGIATSLPYLLFCAVYISVFYLHTELLIPILFLHKKYITYGMALLVLVTAVFIIKPFDKLVSQNRIGEQSIHQGLREFDRPPPPGSQQGSTPDNFKPFPRESKFQPNSPTVHFDITGIFIFLMIIGLGSALQAMKQWQLSEKRVIISETQKAVAELSFLKAQINPHFLYNTLNNIYTLCITGSEHAAESVMKLSKIMRYVTEESEVDFVPLQDEVECIKNYVSLQQLRLGKNVTLNFNITGDSFGKNIAPLVLMTFIENAFKYGLSNHVATDLDISLTIAENKIILTTSNQIFDIIQHEEGGGIGIENTKRRLNYLYSDAHSLTISAEERIFKVLLILEAK
jgi:two-component system LytT family sensor kinase